MNEFARQLTTVIRLARRRSANSTSPDCPFCGSDVTHRPKVEKKDQHECYDCYEPFTTADADVTKKPGQEKSDGNVYEPDSEPDLEQFAIHKLSNGETTDETSHVTGFITRDGRGIPMGSMGTRNEDHRAVIPTEDAMRRWGWPEDIIRQSEEGTRTPALFEMMKRSGLVRFDSDSGKGHSLMISLATHPTPKQIEAIELHAIRHRSEYAVIDPRNGEEKELRGEQLWELGKHLKAAARRIDTKG